MRCDVSKERSITLLAEKVENRAELDRCREEPFALFQGYFFCRPELVRGRRLDAQRTTLLKLLAALHQDDVQIATLERMIGRDVGLSYRLLRYLNSAYFGLGDVRSIGQALALLGIENVKSWAILSAYGVIDDKPAELAVTALVRARFCELAAAQVPAANSREMFTLGLFSVIDAAARHADRRGARCRATADRHARGSDHARGHRGHPTRVRSGNRGSR